MLHLTDVVAVIAGWGSIGIVTLFAINSDKGKKFIRWIAWDFSGIRFIWEKIWPPANPSIYKRPPATFLPWLICAYLVFFGAASYRYEQSVNRIEKRANVILTQLATPAYKMALNKIPSIQNMPCPYKPKIFEPSSIYRSLFFEDKYTEIVELLAGTIEDWKDSLNAVELRGANLQKARLWKADLKESNLKDANLQDAKLWDANLQDAKLWDANLRKANLKGANLRGSDLRGVNLQEADLRNADLQKADLRNANLQKADLRYTNLQKADLRGANLQESNLLGAKLKDVRLWDANLRKADLKGAKYLIIEELCKVQNLYKAKLDPELERRIKKRCHHLLKNG